MTPGWSRPYGDTRYHFIDGHPTTYRCGRRRRPDVVQDAPSAVPRLFRCAHCVYCLEEIAPRTFVAAAIAPAPAFALTAVTTKRRARR